MSDRAFRFDEMVDVHCYLEKNGQFGKTVVKAAANMRLVGDPAWVTAPAARNAELIKELIMNTPVVLITGGLTGIGRAAAVAFAKKGAKVVVAGRREEAGKALVKELRSLGTEAEFINADVRKEDDVRNMVDKTVARFGRLDVAVTMLALKVRLARSRTRPPRAMPRRSTRMFSA